MKKMERDANAKYDKNTKNSKSSIRFLSRVPPHHKDKTV